MPWESDMKDTMNSLECVGARLEAYRPDFRFEIFLYTAGV